MKITKDDDSPPYRTSTSDNGGLLFKRRDARRLSRHIWIFCIHSADLRRSLTCLASCITLACHLIVGAPTVPVSSSQNFHNPIHIILPNQQERRVLTDGHQCMLHSSFQFSFLSDLIGLAVVPGLAPFRSEFLFLSSGLQDCDKSYCVR